MHTVFAHDQAKSASDSAWVAISRICDPDHVPCCVDDIITFPDHCTDGLSGNIGHNLVKEGSACVLRVVFLHKFARRLGQFAGNQLETSLFELSNDFGEQVALDGLRFGHNESALARLSFNSHA